MKKFVSTPYDFGADKLKAIKSRTLIIAADGDGVGGGYMIDFGPIPAAQLALLPGSSHISVMMQTEWLLSMITPFLNTTLQQKKK